MDFPSIIITLVILVFSAILHEIAHGFVAERLGDPTARLSGRLTLNPLKHIDPFMTILLPLFLIVSGSPVIFGGAKPVPIDPFNFKEGRKDIALVSLAGPLTNILLAVGAAILFKLLFFSSISGGTFDILSTLLHIVAQLNILLAIFNLLPIPPLDGSKIFALVLPEREAAAYLSIGTGFTGLILIFLFLWLLPVGQILFSVLGFAQKLLGM